MHGVWNLVEIVTSSNEPCLFRKLFNSSTKSFEKLFGNTIYLIEDGRLFDRSTAALRIARQLSFPWWLGAAGLVLPRVLRDVAYRFVARNRYRWFGRTNECRVPTPELRARMLG